MKLFFSFFLLGLSFGSGPCLVSCGPLLISYTAGTALGIARSLVTYLVFSLSRLAVYLVLGLSVFFLGQAITEHSLGRYSRYAYFFGGIFIVAMGALVMFGRNLNHALCQRASALFLKRNIKTVVVFGLITGILPCAPLISILSYIVFISDTWLKSLWYSLAFGLGTVVSPLVVLVVFAGLIPRTLIAREKFSRIFNALCGAVIVVLGVLLLGRAL